MYFVILFSSDSDTQGNMAAGEVLQAGHTGSNAAASRQASWDVCDALLCKISAVVGHLCQRHPEKLPSGLAAAASGPHRSITEGTVQLQALCKDRHSTHSQPTRRKLLF